MQMPPTENQLMEEIIMAAASIVERRLREHPEESARLESIVVFYMAQDGGGSMKVVMNPALRTHSESQNQFISGSALEKAARLAQRGAVAIAKQAAASVFGVPERLQ